MTNPNRHKRHDELVDMLASRDLDTREKVYDLRTEMTVNQWLSICLGATKNLYPAANAKEGDAA